MAHQNIKISREELYKKVWSTPMIQLAKQFNISDRGLAKLCKKHQIPVPGLGYWAKLEHGKPVEQTPLPSIVDDKEIIITFLEEKTEYIDENQLIEANNIIAPIREQQKIPVCESLTDPHKIVSDSYKSLKNAKKDEDGILIPKNNSYLNIKVSQNSLMRTLCIMDTIIKSLEKYNICTRIDNENGRNTYADVLGESISFTIIERHDTIEKELTSKEKKDKEYFPWSYPKYKYIPNGKLSLKIEGLDSYYATGLRQQWNDGSKQKIEDCIGSFIIGLVKAAVKIRSENLRREAINREWEERRKRELELQRRREEEQKRIDELNRHVNAWNSSLMIRKYLKALEEAVLKKYKCIEEGSEMDLWLKWAYSYADRLDPLVE